MGINGLLPLLKSIQKPVNLKNFDGKTLAVDAYGWLHRGTVACAMELATGKPTKKFVEFSMHRVRMLQHFGVTPFLIFDGDYLPSKAKTEDERLKRRADSKKAGLDLLKAGKPSQAYLEFQKAVDVTPEMARQLIDELKKAGVQYIVAPYEADAQMVYLERIGIVDGILSEDSDLLVFGAKCLLTKLDQYGNCVEVNKADFCSCKEVTLTGWSDKEFRQMAILSGCDYLSSINNIGLKTAYRMVRKHKTIEKVIRMLQFDGKFHVPKDYLDKFYQAEYTFLHQRVFCPRSLSLVLHTQPEQPIDEEKMHYIGAYVEPKIAQAVARGDLNPMTKLPIIGASSSSVSSNTPWASRAKTPRRRPEILDSKMKGTPINQYFKSRTILGELDPNSVNLSPSQQEALTRNPGPWAAVPVSLPRHYIQSSPMEPTLPQSAPPRIQSVRTTRNVSISEPRPKRARLCEDVEDVSTPGREVKLGPSRFFASNSIDPSPSTRRNVHNKRHRKSDVNIFSDDSIDEAMLSLPDLDSEGHTPGQGRKLAVFKDCSADKEESKDSQESSISYTSLVPSLTFATRSTSPGEAPPTPTESTSTPRTLDLGLKSRFAFNASRTQTHTPRHSLDAQDLPTPPSSIPKQYKSSIPVKINIPVAPSVLTPLQRLGAAATNRYKFPMTPPKTPIVSTKPNLTRRSVLSKALVPFPEVKIDAVKATDPAMIPLPTPDNEENVALNMVGSEDCIIPDSEGEGSPVSPSRDDNKFGSLDLGRFVFTT